MDSKTIINFLLGSIIPAIGAIWGYARLNKTVEVLEKAHENYKVDQEKLFINFKTAVDREIANLHNVISEHRETDDKEFNKMANHAKQFFERIGTLESGMNVQHEKNSRADERWDDVKLELTNIKVMIQQILQGKN